MLGGLSKELLPCNIEVATPKNIIKLLHSMHKLGDKKISKELLPCNTIVVQFKERIIKISIA